MQKQATTAVLTGKWVDVSAIGDLSPQSSDVVVSCRAVPRALICPTHRQAKLYNWADDSSATEAVGYKLIKYSCCIVDPLRKTIALRMADTVKYLVKAAITIETIFIRCFFRSPPPRFCPFFFSFFFFRPEVTVCIGRH